MLINPDIYFKDPLEIIKINKGGLVFHGGLIAAITASIVFMKKSKQPLLETLDILCVYVPLAHAIGRVGCFLNGCCSGKPTQIFLGVIFPGYSLRVHPTQLYSSFLLLVLFMVLYSMEKKKHFPGQMISLYLILYGIIRFCIEFLRDNPVVFFGLSMYQCIRIAFVLIGLILYNVLKNKKKSGEFEKKI